MKIKRFASAAVISLLLAAGHAAEAAPAPPAGSFDELLGAAKSAMTVDPAAAFARSDQALKLALKAPESPERRVRVATAQWLEGEALLRLNRADEAAPILAEAVVAVGEAQPNTTLHGRVIMAQATVLLEQGHLDRALAGLQAAQRIFASAQDRRGEAMALQNIGSIYYEAGEFGEVLNCYAQAAERYPGDPGLLVIAYNNRANALKELGRYDEAEAEFLRALRIGREMGSTVLQARILSNMAASQVRAGRLAAAEVTLAQALNLSEADPAAREWRTYLLGVSAQAALQRGNSPLAARLIGRMFEAVDPQTTGVIYREFHETASRAYRQVGDGRLAAQHQRAAERLSRAHYHLASAQGGCGTGAAVRIAAAGSTNVVWQLRRP
jgi:tetratricopeptide (TPR) repeat protein